MGVVYKARQLGLNRLVALKMILTGGHAGERELARFRSEAEAVARLQHPNIVQIHEVGEQNGLPYFSLELVEGSSLAARLKGTPQPARSAAQLLETLARAVHAAHECGIVHRDLKPANILLTADGVPKVTDFGLAKYLERGTGPADESHPRAAGALTQTGAILGSPSYMAPEQAAGNNDQVGPAADVYSLGAILYEMLTGRPPFVAETPFDTVMLVVGQEPVPPRRLQPKVPRDLETICLECLQKEPRKRYASSQALAEDLHRFLQGEPILARPTSLLERTLKWVRRRPAVAGSLAAVAVALAVLVGVILAFNLQLQEERDYALDQRNAADQARADAEARRDEAKQKAIEARRQRRQALANLRLARQVLDEYVTKVTQDQRLSMPGLEELRRDWLLAAQKYYRKFLKQGGRDPAVRAERARAHLLLAGVTEKIGSHRKALGLYRRGINILIPLTRKSPHHAGYQHDLAACYHGLSSQYDKTGAKRRAVKAERKALGIMRRLVRDHPTDHDYAFLLVLCYNNLGLLYKDQGKYGWADLALRRALTLLNELPRRRRPDFDPRSLRALLHFNLGELDRLRGRFTPAEKYYLRALSLADCLKRKGQVAGDVQNVFNLGYTALAALYDNTGRPNLAERYFRKAQHIFDQMVTAHPAVTDYQHVAAGNHVTLAIHYFQVKRFRESETEYRKGLAGLEKLAAEHRGVPAYQKNLATAYVGLAGVYLSTRQPVKAERALRNFLAAQQRLIDRYPLVARYRSNKVFGCQQLAELFRANGRPKWAEKEYRRALALQQSLHHDYPTVTKYTVDLAGVCWNFGRLLVGRHPEEARALFDRALRLLDGVLSTQPGHARARKNRRIAYENRAQLFRGLGRHAAAAADRKQVVGEYERLAREKPEDVGLQQELARQFRQLASWQKTAGDLAAAEQTWRKSIAVGKKLLQRSLGATEITEPAMPARALGETYSKLALTLADLGPAKAAQAEALYRRTIALCQNLVAADPTNAGHHNFQAGTYCNLGILLAGRGTPAKALPQYARAIAILEGVLKKPGLNKDWRNTALEYLRNTHHARAVALSGLRRTAEALADWQRGVNLQVRLARVNPTDLKQQRYVVNLYLQLARNQKQAQRPAEAVDTYRRAARFLKTLAGAHPKDAGNLDGLAKCHEAIGNVFLAAGRKPKAAAAFQEAVDYRLRLVAAPGGTEEDQRDLVNTLNRLLQIAEQTGQAFRVQTALEKAVQSWALLARLHPKIAHYQIGLARGQTSLGNIYNVRKKYVRAEAAFRQGQALWDRLARSLDPGTYRGQIRPVIACHAGLADVYYATDQPAKADPLYRKAVALRAPEVRSHPEDLALAVEHGGNLCNLGNIAQTRKQTKAALDWYRRSIRVLGRVVKKNPRQALAGQFLQNAYCGRGHLLTRLERYGEALADLDRGIPLAEGPMRKSARWGRVLLLVQLKNHARAGREADALAGEFGLPGDRLFLLGVGLARCAADVGKDTKYQPADREKLADRYAARALALLVRARAAGFFNTPARVEFLKKSPDLAALRSRAAFQKWVQEVQEEMKKKKNK
jgi:serine/threonine-protein kinase